MAPLFAWRLMLVRDGVALVLFVAQAWPRRFRRKNDKKWMAFRSDHHGAGHWTTMRRSLHQRRTSMRPHTLDAPSDLSQHLLPCRLKGCGTCVELDTHSTARSSMER